MAACSNAPTEETKTEPAKDNTATAAAPLEYPYKLSSPYKDWQPGDQQHAVNAMKALLAFEKNDIAGSVKYFADSVKLFFDYYQATLSNDSLAKFFIAERSRYKDYTVSMDDWESVISKDGKTEYVTMWYVQKMTDQKGKTDSVRVINDLKIENGKIAELDEKVQHFPVKK